MASTYFAYIGSKINYLCSDSKVEPRKIKTASLKVIYLHKGKSNIKYGPNFN